MNDSISLNKKYLFPLSAAKELIFYRFSLLLCYAEIVIIAASPHNLTVARIIVITLAMDFSWCFLLKVFILLHSVAQVYPRDYSLPKRMLLMFFVPIAELKLIKEKSNDPVEVYSLLQSTPTDYVDDPEQCHLAPSLFWSLELFFNGYKEPKLYMNCER